MIAAVPNQVVVRGHTDSLPYARRPDDEQLDAVDGARREHARDARRRRASRSPASRGSRASPTASPSSPNDRYDPRNRRISITLAWREGETPPELPDPPNAGEAAVMLKILQPQPRELTHQRIFSRIGKFLADHGLPPSPENYSLVYQLVVDTESRDVARGEPAGRRRHQAVPAGRRPPPPRIRNFARTPRSSMSTTSLWPRQSCCSSNSPRPSSRRASRPKATAATSRRGPPRSSRPIRRTGSAA